MILDTARYKDPTVYHQTDPEKAGYSPNHEHALLAASTLGNAAPALYALRTDLSIATPSLRQPVLCVAQIPRRGPGEPYPGHDLPRRADPACGCDR